MRFDGYRFRCSSLGKLMGPLKNTLTENQSGKLADLIKKSAEKPLTKNQEDELKELMAKRDAPKELPDTCTSYLKEIYNQEVKGFKIDISSKYFEKGMHCEEDAISMLQKTLFHSFRAPIFKNRTRMSNEFIEGEHDVKVLDVIVDIKNAWSWKTLDNASLTKDYEYQLRGYMALNNCNEAILFYCLVNLPDFMMKDILDKMFYTERKWISKESEGYQQACDEMMEMYDFNRFPVEQRFRSFRIEHSQEIVDSMYQRIRECRTWLNNYHAEQEAIYSQNRFLMGLQKELA